MIVTGSQTVTKWNHEALAFSIWRRRRVWAHLSGGSTSSNGGAWHEYKAVHPEGLQYGQYCERWKTKFEASAAAAGANRRTTSTGSSWKVPNERFA